MFVLGHTLPDGGVQGLMNVMCTQPLHTTRHLISEGWEEWLGVDIGSGLIKGSRMKFLRSLIEDLQTRFKGTEWDASATVEDWVDASSCSCERVFSYVTATDFGQTTERKCETLWVRCNGVAPEDWGPFEVFDDLRKTPFRPRKRKQGHALEVEDGGLIGFAAVKDWPISLEEDGQAEVQLDIQGFWFVSKRATRHADIGDVYRVELEGEDEESEDEDLEPPGELASSSSSDLRNPSTVPSTSSNPAAYDVDEAVLNAIEWRSIPVSTSHTILRLRAFQDIGPVGNKSTARCVAPRHPPPPPRVPGSAGSSAKGARGPLRTMCLSCFARATN